MEVSDSKFLTKYRNYCLREITKIHPTWDKDKVKNEIDYIIEESLRNPQATVENNYTHEKAEVSLLSILDWSMEKKPIIAGNGTFYKQHKDAINLNATMLMGFLSKRDQIKKEMFSIEDAVSWEYRMKDLSQTNVKKLANSYYGGAANKASAFYNKFSGPAITKSAQSVISTAMTTFEAFLASNFTFVDINECIYWLHSILDEKVVLENWIERVSLEDAFDRVSSHIIGATKTDLEFLHQFMETLNEEELTKIYWKNNLMKFISVHQEIQDLYDCIFSSIHNYSYMSNDNDFSVVPKKYKDTVRNSKNPMKTWNNIVDKENFFDPNDVPESIKEYIEKLNDYFMKYIYSRFLYTDRIYKLKNFKRSVVTVIDTDSNILSLDTFMEYCLTYLKKGDYGRSDWNNIFIAVNSVTYFITSAITDTLEFYGKMSNVAKEYRGGYKMKNEYFFANLIIAKVKKRYLAKIILREGHLLKKPKYDIKGFDFKKASTSQDASDFFIKIVEELILEPEQIDLKKLMMELQRFRNTVRKSLEKGERKYLPMGNAKELDGYDDPDRQQSVRAATAWNLLYPTKAVEFPVKISILKLNINKLSDVEDLKEKEPEIYDTIASKIFGDPKGMFVKRSKSTGKIEYRGLVALGIPLHEKIPDWAIDYIDYTTVINSVLAPFNSITETFNLPSIEEGKSGKKTTGFSNIIRI